MSLQVMNSYGATLGANSIAIIDDRHILYLCGKYICLYTVPPKGEHSSSENSQQFLHGTKDGKQIKAICTSPTSSRTRGIAFAENECMCFYSTDFFLEFKFFIFKSYF